jgi:four helix bundle protein
MMSEDKSQGLRDRTKRFALRVIRLYVAVDGSGAAGVLARQMLRSGTSVGAQYREACRARSQAEFISKIESALQELDETLYWFELLTESGLVAEARLTKLKGEADELLSMLVASVRTAKGR